MNKKNKFRNRIKVKRSKYVLLTVSFILLIVSSFIVSGCSTDENQTVAQFTELIWADEFDVDGAPNPNNWGYDIGTGFNGWGNNELQYYTDRPENVVVQNGILIITAREESFQGSNYTSARLKTKGKFSRKYGRFEARIWLPSGKGLWPAFWMLGNNIEEELDTDLSTLQWPFCGEIDIMENAGSKPTIISGAIHGPGWSGGSPILKEYDLGNDRVDSGFHIYGIEWGPDYVNFYVDDVLYKQITPDDLPSNPFPEFYGDVFTDPVELEEYETTWNKWVYDQPFYMLLNLAVGGLFDGPPNAETVFPQTMLVDYVRVYKNEFDNN
ncbi:MAG: glycoside hydrolase family 16 protein [Flavobacteriaceae bacterium]|nr:glycoside hydrolase family 16 protein [Flavobacteriaceae bacterium]